VRLWKGDKATRTRDPGRGCAVVRGLVGGIDGAVGHASVAVVKGAVVEFTVPAMFEDMFRAELVPEAEDAVRARLRGVEVVFGMFEGSELFNRKVFRELFDGEVGKIVRHSMGFWSVGCVSFNPFVLVANCSLLVDW